MVADDSGKNKNKNVNASVDFMGAFSASLEQFFPDILKDRRDIAVAVSGGADSLSLCHALSRIYTGRIHALTVDHRLRPEAADEARYVSEVFQDKENVIHKTLVWEFSEKPNVRVQEEARNARYTLMTDYMREQGIQDLFLGHHMDDQAETFLFRLAKGSGLDGLACMSPVSFHDSGMRLCRPFLSFSKDDLVEYCREYSLEYVDDPSNNAEKYARVRLRRSREALEEEGLSAKRLSLTSARLSRARKALDEIASSVYQNLSNKESERIEIKFNALISNPEEVVLRVILIALKDLVGDSGYGVRMEKAEALCADLLSQELFRKRTLGGVIFEVSKKDDRLFLSRESNKNE